MNVIFRTDFGLSEDQVGNMFLVAVHRLPRRNRAEEYDEENRREPVAPDPVIVRFGSMFDRDGILLQQRVRPYFKDRKPVMAYTDLPASMKQQRGKLVQHAKTLRGEGKQTRIRTIGLDVILEFKDKNNRRGDWKRFTPNN